MKFFDYLEAIRAEALNEIFNIEVKDISLSKRNFDDLQIELLHNLKDIMNNLGYEISSVLNSPEMEKKLFTQIKKDMYGDYSLKTINVYKKLKDIRKKNSYIHLNGEEQGDGNKYLFFVGDKMYVLTLWEQDYGHYTSIDIVFDEFGRGDSIREYSSNSIMGTGSGSELFNKIASITKKEIPGYSNKIFSFSGVLESSERFKETAVRNILKLLFDNLQRYLLQTIKKDNVTQIRTKIDTFTGNVKKKVLEEINKKLGREQDYMNFINFIFSDAPFSSMPPLKKPLDEIPNDLASKLVSIAFDTNVIKNSSMRMRLYRMIIKQMFGSNVNIEQHRGSVLFSLSPIPIDIGDED
jgi:hypothetical protein